MAPGHTPTPRWVLCRMHGARPGYFLSNVSLKRLTQTEGKGEL